MCASTTAIGKGAEFPRFCPPCPHCPGATGPAGFGSCCCTGCWALATAETCSGRPTGVVDGSDFVSALELAGCVRKTTGICCFMLRSGQERADAARSSRGAQLPATSATKSVKGVSQLPYGPCLCGDACPDGLGAFVRCGCRCGVTDVSAWDVPEHTIWHPECEAKTGKGACSRACAAQHWCAAGATPRVE
eukprot:COSAG05_NODE_106_length_18750_cov_677.083105_12_plen_191_part_00